MGWMPNQLHLYVGGGGALATAPTSLTYNYPMNTVLLFGWAQPLRPSARPPPFVGSVGDHHFVINWAGRCVADKVVFTASTSIHSFTGVAAWMSFSADITLR
jgi:hypothetical protein